MKPGDKILTEDGDTGVVVKFGPRNELEQLSGVNLLGNAVIYRSETTGKLYLAYEWEVDVIDENKS